MQLLTNHIKALMVVSGVLTCTMLYAAFLPSAALQSTFGEEISGPAAEIVVRNWGVLIFLMGALLVQGAFNPALRRTALVAAGVSKAAFIALVLADGSRFLSQGAAVPVAVDAVMVVLFATYLFWSRGGASRATSPAS
jgi:hypothetical protein